MSNEELELSLSETEELSIDIPSVEGLELSDTLVEGLGISGVDDIVLEDLDLQLDEIEDAEGDTGGISDAILLRTSVGVVDTMAMYVDRVREAQVIFAEKTQNIDRTKFVVHNSEFPYMPSNVFSAFHSILVDLACEEQYQAVPLEECAARSLDMLYDATHWVARLNRGDYIAQFVKWCGTFRKLAHVKPVVDKSDLSVMLSKEELDLAVRVFEINTLPFIVMNTLFKDAAAVASRYQLDLGDVGAFTSDYMTRNRLSDFTVQDGYNAVGEYLGSADAMSALKLTQDEIIEFSVGELLRRMILYELNSGMLYPTGIRGASPNDLGAIIRMLPSAIQGGSIVAELIYIVATMLLSTGKNDDTAAVQFLAGILQFFQAFLDDPALVNPVFYAHVKKLSDGYELSYAVGEQTYDVKSNDVLCEVVGDKTTTYCIPKVLLDNKKGYVVCPPSQLVIPLWGITIGGRMRISGSVCFRFSPTINWLINNKVLAEDCTVKELTANNAMQSGGNSLLQALIEYDNSFEDSGKEVLSVVLSVNGYEIYAIDDGSNNDVKNIVLVLHNGLDEANDGQVYYDPTDGSIIVSFFDRNQQPVEFTALKGSYQESYLNNASDIEESQACLSDFIYCAKKHGAVEWQEYREAVKRLCELASLDYEEELEEVQRTITRDLYYVVCVPAIDTLVASRILGAYVKFVHDRVAGGEQEGLDPFNVASFTELVDIVMGRPNAFTGCVKWNAEMMARFESEKENFISTVDDVCTKLDLLDFNKIALQVLSRGELRREINLSPYRALHYIPEIGSRLCTLEDKMIVFRVLNVLGEQVMSVFSKRLFLCRAYTSQLEKDNVATMHSILVEKSKRKDKGFTLPLSRDMLGTSNNPEVAVLKYFVLERNIYGLLTAMQPMGEFAQTYQDFLTVLELPFGTDIGGMSQQDFERLVGPDKIVTLCNQYRAELQGIVENGLLCETLNNNGVQLVKAFDLFNSFYDIIVGSLLDDIKEGEGMGIAQYQDDFLTYAGSLVISYCPVVDSSAGEIDGGMNRMMAFVKCMRDFVYDVPIEYLRPLPLQDVRIIIDES